MIWGDNHIKSELTRITPGVTSGTVFTHKHKQRFIKLTLHTHMVHVLGPCTFKLESPLYNCKLSSAHNTSGTKILNLSKFEWIAAFFVESCAHTLLRPNVRQYTGTVGDSKCFYSEHGPPSEICWSSQPSAVHSVFRRSESTISTLRIMFQVKMNVSIFIEHRNRVKIFKLTNHKYKVYYIQKNRLGNNTVSMKQLVN